MRSSRLLAIWHSIGWLLLASTSAANWPREGVLVSRLNAAYWTQVRATSDGAGGALVGWLDTKAYSSSRQDVFLTRIREDGTTDPAWPLHGTTVCDAESNQVNPAICPDGRGGAFMAWMDERGKTGATGTVNWPVFAQAITSSGSVAAGWPPDGMRISPHSNVAPGTIAMAHDSSGGLYITWQEYVEGGGPSEIYVRHVGADGTSSWPERGIHPVVRSGSRNSPEIVSDGADGIYLGWREDNSEASGVYVLRIGPSGTPAPGWPAGGVALFLGTAAYGPSLMVDDGGGLIACWFEIRPEGNAIKAKRLLENGSEDPSWPAGGALLCLVPGWRQAPELASDGNGGALVCWQDFRDGTEVYVQRVSAEGVVVNGWPLDGVRAGPAPGSEWHPSIVSDGSGGAYLLWNDYREGLNGPSACVAQHVLHSGVLAPGWTQSGIRVSLAEDGQQYGALVRGAERNAIVAVSGYGVPGSARVVAQRFNFYGVPAEAFQPRAHFANGQIDLEWNVPSGYTQQVRLYRREADSDWLEIADLSPAFGRISWRDRAISSGATYEYRLGVPEENEEGFYGYVRIPTAAELFLSIVGSIPTRNDLRIRFSMPNSSPARLEVYDVSGRRVTTRDVSAYGQGLHELTLDTRARFASGVYFLRLIQGRSEARTRFVVVR